MAKLSLRPEIELGPLGLTPEQIPVWEALARTCFGTGCPGAETAITPSMAVQFALTPLAFYLGPAVAIPQALSTSAQAVAAGTETTVPPEFAIAIKGAQIVGSGVEGGFMSNGFGDFFSSFDFGEVLQQGVQQIGLPLLRQELLPTQRSIAPVAPLQPQTFDVGFGQGFAQAAAGGLPMPIPMGSPKRLALSVVVNAMRNQGLFITLSRLVTMLKNTINKFGPAAALQFLSGFVVSEIAQRAIMETAIHRRRRINPGNTQALRRSIRRLQSFERLSGQVSARLTSVCRSRSGRKRGTSRSCPTCKATPCRCI